jgi:hypothetical protein
MTVIRLSGTVLNRSSFAGNQKIIQTVSYYCKVLHHNQARITYAQSIAAKQPEKHTTGNYCIRTMLFDRSKF